MLLEQLVAGRQHGELDVVRDGEFLLQQFQRELVLHLREDDVAIEPHAFREYFQQVARDAGMCDQTVPDHLFTDSDDAAGLVGNDVGRNRTAINDGQLAKAAAFFNRDVVRRVSMIKVNAQTPRNQEVDCVVGLARYQQNFAGCDIVHRRIGNSRLNRSVGNGGEQLEPGNETAVTPVIALAALLFEAQFGQ